MTYSLSKLGKHKVMLKSARLRAALPATRTLSKRSLSDYLARYTKVIAKPTGGYGGAGVIQICAMIGGRYQIQSGKHKHTVTGLEAAYSYLRSKCKGKRYLIQKRISLAKVKGRPFDIRVMVQRRRGSHSWKVTGKLAKIAGAGYIITNTARSRGRVVPLSTALRRSNIRGASLSRIERSINSISLAAVRQLHKYYRIRTIGVDAAVDHDGKVWIIEANFKPAVSLFNRLKDKTMYRRIMTY